MPPQGRKRRSEQRDDPELSASESAPQRRRLQKEDGGDDDGSDSSESETQAQTQPQNGIESMVKKMVRLALSCEYSRIPIRRADISAKVLGEAGSRQFKAVFERAQTELRTTFGMQMEELLSREKYSISQRRAAQASQKASSTSSKSWILISTLPTKYKSNPDILPPPKAPSENIEATYIALYSFIIALILLNNGSLPEAKLERYLKRANAEQWTPILSTDRLMQRLNKEGYVDKRVDKTGDEEILEWVVGPRGKIEVGKRGVQHFIKAVYEGTGEDEDELDRKLDRSLGLQQQHHIVVEASEETPEANGNAERGRRTRGAARRRTREDDVDE